MLQVSAPFWTMNTTELKAHILELSKSEDVEQIDIQVALEALRSRNTHDVSEFLEENGISDIEECAC